MVTFTLRSQSDSLEAEQYIIKQFTERPALKVVEAHMVKEQTQAGVDHWHVCVATSKYLAKDRFNYYEKLYGHVDLSKNHSQNLHDAANYMAKSNTPIQLI